MKLTEKELKEIEFFYDCAEKAGKNLTDSRVIKKTQAHENVGKLLRHIGRLQEA